MPFPVYDFTDSEGKSVIALWRNGLTKRDKGALDSKLNMLALNGTGLSRGLLAGPINKTKHIYKLIIHADTMLRPMLCKGPFDPNSDFTLLLGAKEIQFKLVPGPEEALKNRDILLGDKSRRKLHEW